MKKIITAMLLLATVVILMPGCTKDNKKGALTFTINGTTWQSSSASGANTGNGVIVNGIKNDGSQITISTNGGSGSFTITATNGNSVFYTDGSNNVSNSVSGTINIESSSSSGAKGTFNAVMDNGTTITNGSFDVTAF